MSFGLVHDTVSAITTLSLSVVKAGRELMGCNGGMAAISELPVEILARIFSFLPAKDIASVSQVNRLFNEACYIDSIWIYRSLIDYSVYFSPCCLLSCRDIYTKVLYKYGKLLGMWQPAISSYGGLLSVHYQDGTLVGTDLFPPIDPNITEPLRKKVRFKIFLDCTDDNVGIQCIGGYNAPHLAEISKFQKNEFMLKCCSVASHLHPEGRHQGLLDWLLEESSAPFQHHVFAHSQELLLMKYLTICQYNYAHKYVRISMPKRCVNVPIQPGLFKGTYGAHGLELVMLDYKDDFKMASVVKISGDPNVPAGKVTFHVNLDYGIIVDETQQTSMAALEIGAAHHIAYRHYNFDKKPFKVPDDCLERFHDVPQHCIARFQGFGQIAGHGFTNPSFCGGHWIIFNEDLFGFLWIDLMSLSMYHRVQENIWS